MSDRLKQSLITSRGEIEAGLAEAESELARVRQRARELEELIALGTATLLAAEMISGGSRGNPAPAPSPASVSSANLAAGSEKSKDELQSRMSKSPK